MKGVNVLRKSAVAILLSAVILIISTIGVGIYFIYQHFSGEPDAPNKSNYISAKGPDISEMKGKTFKLNTSNLEYDSKLFYTVGEGILLEGAIGQSTDSLYNLDTAQKDVINHLKNASDNKNLTDKELLENYAKSFRTILIPIEVENKSNQLQPFGNVFVRDISRGSTFGEMKDVYTVDTSPTKETKDSKSIMYDYYLTGDLSLQNLTEIELKELAALRVALKSTSASSKAIKELNLMDVSTPLLPSEKRSGMIAITSTKENLSNETALLIYADDDAKKPIGSVMTWGAEKSAAYIAKNKATYDNKTAKEGIKKDSITDLYLGEDIKFESTIKNPKDVKMKVNRVVTYPNAVYNASKLYRTHKEHFAFDESTDTVLVAIEIEARALRDNAVIDGKFTVNDVEIPQIRFGRNEGELLPDYQSDYRLFTYRGLDLDKDVYISGEKSETYTEKTPQKDFLENEKEIGYIYLSLPESAIANTKNKLQINYK